MWLTVVLFGLLWLGLLGFGWLVAATIRRLENAEREGRFRHGL